MKTNEITEAMIDQMAMKMAQLALAVQDKFIDGLLSAPVQARNTLLALQGDETVRDLLVAGFDAALRNERNLEPQTESTYEAALRGILTKLYDAATADRILKETDEGMKRLARESGLLAELERED